MLAFFSSKEPTYYHFSWWERKIYKKSWPSICVHLREKRNPSCNQYPRDNELLVTSERTEEAKKYFQGKFINYMVSQMWFKNAEFGVKINELFFLTCLLHELWDLKEIISLCQASVVSLTPKWGFYLHLFHKDFLWIKWDNIHQNIVCCLTTKLCPTLFWLHEL